MEWIILGVIVLLTLINVPIGYALSIATILAILWTGAASLSVVPLNLFSGASSFPLLAIPLFILAGGLMETSGISQRLVNLANSLVGFIRGGLAMVTVVATMIQSEISGSSVADAAAIGKVVIPAMEKRGYPRALSAAIVSNAASAAILIPPSIPMIIYAWMAEVSIAKLFFAGFLPGFIACVAMMGLCYYYARKYNLPKEKQFSVREVGRSTVQAFWALTIPIVIWVGILGGIATATEVAALAVVAAALIGVVIYRELSGRQTLRIFRESSSQTATVMLIVASLFVRFSEKNSDHARDTDEEHDPPGDRQHAADPSHFDPRQRDGGFVAHPLHEDPAVVEQHELEAEHGELGRHVDDLARQRRQLVHQNVESDVAALVVRHDRAVESQPDEHVRGELVIPGKRGIEDIAEEHPEADNDHQPREEADGPPLDESDEPPEQLRHQRSACTVLMSSVPPATCLPNSSYTAAEALMKASLSGWFDFIGGASFDMSSRSSRSPSARAKSPVACAILAIVPWTSLGSFFQKSSLTMRNAGV